MDVIHSMLNSTLCKPGGLSHLAGLNSWIHQNYSITASTPGKKRGARGKWDTQMEQ